MTSPIPGQSEAPPGFERMPPFGPFHELIGPIYVSTERPGTLLGFRVQEKHRNRSPTPMVHGGMIATLIDTACAWGGKHAREPKPSVVTTNLSIQLIGNAGPGEWVEAHVEVLRAGRSVIFVQCKVKSGDRLLAHANAQFQVMGTVAE
jgi:uncharacterized protein (TIGR00369 family)